MPPVSASARAPLAKAKSAKAAMPAASSRGAGGQGSTSRAATEKGAATRSVLDRKKAAQESGSGSTAPSPAPSGSGDDHHHGPKGRALRADPKSLKAVTSGQTAVVEFVDESEVVPLSSSPSQPQRDEGDDAIAGAPPRQRWECQRWLSEVENLIGCLAAALCTDEEGAHLRRSCCKS